MNFFYISIYHYLTCIFLYIISINIDYTILLHNTKSLRESNYDIYININENFYSNMIVTMPLINTSFEIIRNVYIINVDQTFQIKNIIMLHTLGFLFLFYKNTNYNTSVISNHPSLFFIFCMYFKYIEYYVNLYNVPYMYILIFLKIVFNTIRGTRYNTKTNTKSCYYLL